MLTGVNGSLGRSRSSLRARKWKQRQFDRLRRNRGMHLLLREALFLEFAQQSREFFGRELLADLFYFRNGQLVTTLV